MAKRMDTAKTVKGTVLDEIIERAVGLSIENQNKLLMIAKAMRYTRDCVSSQYAAEEPSAK